MELRNTLGEKFGIELPPSLALDFPTASAIAGHIASLSAPVAIMTAAPGDFDAAPRRALQGTFARDAAEPTAIVGLSARFPSGIRSANQFWGAVSSSANLQDQVHIRIVTSTPTCLLHSAPAPPSPAAQLNSISWLANRDMDLATWRECACSSLSCIKQTLTKSS